LNTNEFFSKLFRWQKGRQNTGYDKMLVGDGLWPYPFDVYILRFREGQEIPPHVDKVDRGEHYRLNIVLKAAASSFVDHQYLKIGASNILDLTFRSTQ
jgi:hypothetical protein